MIKDLNDIDRHIWLYTNCLFETLNISVPYIKEHLDFLYHPTIHTYHISRLDRMKNYLINIHNLNNRFIDKTLIE